ncbi:MAG: hypothetical protein WDW38_008051 [Sanguina aurantia]
MGVLPQCLSLIVICALILQVCSVDIDGSKVVSQLTELAKLSDDPNPAVTRVLYTPNDMHARRFIKTLMTEAKLVVREDSVGNIFGRWAPAVDSASTVLTGSHCDAIPLAGMYDGTLGVVGGIAAIAALQAAGFVPETAIEVVMFTSEEPTRFGLSCIGSRAMVGTLEEETLSNKLDENGTSVLEAANSAGYAAASYEELLSGALLAPGYASHFVELHIEQGPYLEQEGIDIGIVTAIAAPAALEVQFFGDGGHAGGQLMPLRNDAGLAGAELSLALEAHVLGTGAPDTVGTCGTFEVKPGAVNSVPRYARLGIDIRDTDGERRDSVVAAVLNSAQEIGSKRKVRHTVRFLNQDPPATCHDDIISAVVAASLESGVSTKHMVSRAYHDSLFMARVAPTGMIFIPCRNGWSHRPDEFSSEDAIAKGVKVLALTLAKLAGGEFKPVSHTVPEALSQQKTEL